MEPCRQRICRQQAQTGAAYFEELPVAEELKEAFDCNHSSSLSLVPGCRKPLSMSKRELRNRLRQHKTPSGHEHCP